jgi:hypothetical protein
MTEVNGPELLRRSASFSETSADLERTRAGGWLKVVLSCVSYSKSLQVSSSTAVGVCQIVQGEDEMHQMQISL